MSNSNQYDCDALRSRLDAYIDGQTDVAESARIASHLGTCEQCRREYLLSLRMLEDISLSAEDPPEGLHDAIMDRILTEQAEEERNTDAMSATVNAPSSTPAPRRKTLSYFLRAVLPLAAAFLCVISIAFPLSQRVRKQESTKELSSTQIHFPSGSSPSSTENKSGEENKNETELATEKEPTDPSIIEKLPLSAELPGFADGRVWVMTDLSAHLQINGTRYTGHAEKTENGWKLTMDISGEAPVVSEWTDTWEFVGGKLPGEVSSRD